MMQIIVDKMPEKVHQCPYAKDVDGYSKYSCTWNQCGRECRSVEDCPFFTDKESKLKILDECLSAKYKYEHGSNLGGMSIADVREIIEEMRCN